MSSIKNWCVLAVPVLSVLAGCGADVGGPADTTRLEEASERQATSVPILSATATPLPGRIDTALEGLPGGVLTPPLGNPQCTPANPQSCNLAKSCESPPAPPPEIKLVGCTIQVMLESVTAASGQGATEGNLEMNVLASSAGDSLRWPESGEVPIAVEDHKDVAETVAEYQLQPKQKRNIDVCATFTEDDDNGANGASDVGQDCETVEISCKLAKDGPLTVEVSAPLCKGDNRDENGVCKSYNGEASAQFRVGVSDEDWDNVPNDEDATPEPEDEACRGQEGRAVVLFVDFGTSDLNDLVGLVGMGVDNFVSEYDWVGIATDPLNVAGFTLREETLANADMLVPPTLEGLVDTFRVATSHGYDITFFALGHGGADTVGEAYFTSADPSGLIYESDLSGALSPQQFGTCDVPFRAINSLACYFSQMNSMWLDRGTKVASGARFGEFFPQELNGFVRSWNDGDRFGVALGKSFDPIVRGVNRLAIEGVGAATGLITECHDSVLGLNGCAEQFFTQTGPTSMSFTINGRNDYDSTRSGQENMDTASADVVAGQATLDKFTPLTWP